MTQRTYNPELVRFMRTVLEYTDAQAKRGIFRGGNASTITDNRLRRAVVTLAEQLSAGAPSATLVHAAKEVEGSIMAMLTLSALEEVQATELINELHTLVDKR